MNLKENSSIRRKNKEQLITTADVGKVLRAINHNGVGWKNKSAKFTKTTTGKGLASQPQMTEEQVEQLFQKDKLRTEAIREEEWGNCRARDFANRVRFLRVENEEDRLLTGVPEGPAAEELSEERGQDLTAQFKRDYLVGKVVGEGAYACVRVAIYKPLGRKVAIKIYEKGKIRETPRRKSVRREIRILQLLDHPHIVRIYDVVETNNHLNIVMEYLPGISLNSYLKSQPGSRAPEKTCKSIVRALAEALMYLHERQISHRDIKLENVILDEELAPKLIDFGFSTCIERTKKVKIFCGTPSYMAPEIVQKREYRGEPADIWALGVLLFVSATGLFPFKGATDQELYRRINGADYPRAELLFSRELADLVARMLRPLPEDRPTAAEVLAHEWMHSLKKEKRVESCYEPRKQNSSAVKSKEKEKPRKLTETCHENLHLELRMLRQEPAESGTHRRLTRDVRTGRRDRALPTQLKDVSCKPSSRVVDFLRMEIRKRQEEKNHSKPKRL